MTSSIIKRLAQSTPPADIDRSAMIRELTSYTSGDDDAVAAALGTILDTPQLATARGLSEALAHLVTLERQPLAAAAAEALTRLWTRALDPLPDHERRRAARLSSALDAAPPAHRAAWALRSEDPNACADVASHFTQEHWGALRPILTASLEPNAPPALLRAIFERSDEGVRAGALELLDEESDPTLLEPLAISLPGSSSSYLTALAHALDRMGRVEAKPILLAILTSHSREVAEDLAALHALSTLGTATSVAPLHELEGLSARSSPFHDAIAQTLERLTQRLTASGPAGALSLTSSTSREGALSLHERPGDGALALYESVLRNTSGGDAVGPTAEPDDLLMVEPNPPLSFWLTWPSSTATRYP